MGHTDMVRSIAYVKDCDTYVTGSWDKSLRLWFRPKERKAQVNSLAAGAGAAEGAAPNMLLLEYDDDDDHFVSEYERAHPLEIPKQLTENHEAKLLQNMGVFDDDDGGGGKKKGRRGGHKAADMDLGLDAGVPDLPGTLGSKLEDLGRNLLYEINTIAFKGGKQAGAGTGMGGMAGHALDDERMSTRSSMAPSMAPSRGGRVGPAVRPTGRK